jgi:hypothetical protein
MSANSKLISRAPSRFQPLLIVGAVHLALVIVALRLMSLDMPEYRWPRWQCIFMEALVTSQVSLLTIWLILGNASLPVRASGCAFAIATWLVVLEYLSLDNEYWPLVLSTQAVLVSLGLIAARLAGLKLRGRSRPLESLAKDGGNRFSLQQMLQWVAAFAFLMFLSTVVQMSGGVGGYEVPMAVALGVLLAVVALSASSAALSAKRRFIPLLSLIAVTVVVGLLAGEVDRLYRHSWWSSLPREAYTEAYQRLIGLYAILTSWSLYSVRAAGWRLSKVDLATT